MIVEVGSRDALDALTLQNQFNCEVIAFEANPESFEKCKSNLVKVGNSRIRVRNEALTNTNGTITFWSVDSSKYENVGASSLLKIDFNNRHEGDADYKRPEVQVPIEVEGVRYESLDLAFPDLLVIDVEGAELRVLEGFGAKLNNISYIVLEVAPVSHHVGGTNLRELNQFLKTHGFKYVAWDAYGEGALKLHVGLLRAWRHARLLNLFSPAKPRGFFNAIYVKK